MLRHCQAVSCKKTQTIWQTKLNFSNNMITKIKYAISSCYTRYFLFVCCICNALSFVYPSMTQLSLFLQCCRCLRYYSALTANTNTANNKRTRFCSLWQSCRLILVFNQPMGISSIITVFSFFVPAALIASDWLLTDIFIRKKQNKKETSFLAHLSSLVRLLKEHFMVRNRMF